MLLWYECPVWTWGKREGLIWHYWAPVIIPDLRNKLPWVASALISLTFHYDILIIHIVIVYTEKMKQPNTYSTLKPKEWIVPLAVLAILFRIKNLTKKYLNIFVELPWKKLTCVGKDMLNRFSCNKWQCVFVFTLVTSCRVKQECVFGERGFGNCLIHITGKTNHYKTLKLTQTHMESPLDLII